MTHIVGAIFARGGSKGVPRKNIRLLAGKPLIAYSIGTALQVSLIERVIVSTDDAEIAEVARRCGAEVPFIRPAELAGDQTPELLAWQHAIHALEAAPGGKTVDVLVSLPTTSPFRAVEDVDACIRALLESGADIAITAAATSNRNPYFNMIVIENGYARPSIQPAHPVTRRQDAPAVFDMTTVAYAARRDFVLRARSIFDGKAKAVFVPEERAMDIDSEQDFRIADFLMSQKPAEREA